MTSSPPFVRSARRRAGALVWSALAATLLAAPLAACRSDRTTVVQVSSVVARIAVPDTTTGAIELRYRLIGDMRQDVGVIIEFSKDDKVTYQTAVEDTQNALSEGRAALSVSPSPGETHVFAWKDFPEDTVVVVSVIPVVDGKLGIPDQVGFLTPVRPDIGEFNDDAGFAWPIVPDGSAQPYSIGPDGFDIDYYLYETASSPAATTSAAVVASVKIEFQTSLSDLDLFIEDDFGTAYTESAGDTDVESVRFYAPAGEQRFLHVESFDQIPTRYTLTVEETPVMVYLSESFDTASTTADLATLPSGAWTVTSNAAPIVWELGNPNGGPQAAASYPSVIATVLDGPYASSSDATLITPTVTIATSTRVFVTFDGFIDTEGRPFDFLEIIPIVNGQATTTLGILDEEHTLGGGYDTFVIDGPPGLQPGDTLQLRLRFRSDSQLEGEGIYLDNFRVLGAR